MAFNFRYKKAPFLSSAVLGALAAGAVVSYRSAPSPEVPAPGAGAAAERLLAEARASAGIRESAPPSYGIKLSTADDGPGAARMLVRSAEFEGVAEEPKDVMSALSEMSGDKEPRVPPVRLSETDTGKKVRLKSVEPSRPLAPASMPLPWENGKSVAGGKSLIAAPVGYQLFSGSATWKAFADSHAGSFPEADFSRESMLILVSLSDLPSAIFKVAGLKRTAGETVVLYRVDPLAMAAGSGGREKDLYSAVPVPKRPAVKLQQVP